jgi:signal peptidase I
MTYLPDESVHSGAPASSERATSRRAMGCAFEIVETLVLTLLIYLAIHNFLAQPFEVEQNSMLPTIAPSEYILIDKLTPRFDGYHYGDVVVFEPPDGGAGLETGGVPFIKRVIALPGDTVRLENGRVFVMQAGQNPVRLDEPYVAREADGASAPTLPSAPDGDVEWVVPDGHYFVLGDNRTVSQDSRRFGPIRQELILGRAWLRYFPLERIGVIQRPEYPALADRSAAAIEARDYARAGSGSSATIQLSIARP